MSRVSLLFGVHMHQPVDNFGEAVDEAIEKCYKPFFKTMAKYPQFKFSLHCSGWLLEQIITKHPDITANMQKLTDLGSIEWISAGYYEPILSSIPSIDRVNQIKKLNSYIKKNFKTSTSGLWLTERVWEPSIIPDLQKANIDFTIIDDYHFLSSGFNKRELDGYFKTEESGKELALFPISEALRYALPFFSTQKAIEIIENHAKNKNSAAIIFDDAEKFGLWPKTYEWVYEKEWLKDFVEAILENENIQTEHFEEFKNNNRSRGVAYLNNTSYFEMGEWSLKEQQSMALEKLKKQVGLDYFENIGIAFIKGGIWKNFFIKYEESNRLHKRMLYMSKLQDKMDKKSLELLYRLQTNDVFWHGVFGGLYLPNLRDNAYSYLLEMEKRFSTKKTIYKIDDFDMDGFDELKILTNSLSLMFSQKNGGQMVEFGLLDKAFNWQNTLKRRKEAYHENILNPKERQAEQSDDAIATIHNLDGEIDNKLKENLIFDWHLKYSFIDHISNEPFSLQSFRSANFKEIGDFANQPFVLDKKTKSFCRNGGIYLEDKYNTTIKKRYTFKEKQIKQNFICRSDFKKEVYYGVEFNLHFAHPHKVTFNDNLINDGLNLKEIKSLEIVDDFTNKKISFTFDSALDMNAFVLCTISQSEKGYDMVNQQISFILCSSFRQNLDLTLNIEVTDV
ncbi:MAG: DUF1926 domain-containing protein [Sulfurospirillum sp.]